MKCAFVTLTDDNYIIGTKILLYSFLKNNNWFCGDIVIIYDALKLIYIDDLKRIYLNIKFLQVNPTDYSELNSKYDIDKTRFRNVFYKYEVFELAGYDRILFTDSDVLVCKSIKSLFDYEYNGNIGMVADYGFVRPKTLKTTANVVNDFFTGWYCGGGFFIIDNIILTQYSKQKLIDLAIFDFSLREKGEFINGHLFGNYPEQDVMNKLFTGKIKPIDIKYNFYLNTFSFVEAKNSNITINDIYCIHYVTPKKPWNSDLSKHRIFTKIWKNYYKEFLHIYKSDTECSKQYDSNSNCKNKFTIKRNTEYVRTDCVPIEIDYVFPFVDNNDTVWQQLLEYQSKQYSIPYNPNSQRYNDYGLLKYHLRGIEKNLPFVRNVYLILSGPSQLPKWLNTEKIHIVYHKDIIPEKLLPTFNSTCIEMFLHNIEGLSNYFIYANDDMYSIHRMYKSDFFDENTLMPKLLSTKFKKGNLSDYRKTLVNSELLLRKHYNLPLDENLFYLDGSHSIVPMRLDFMKNLYNEYKDVIYNSCTPFRCYINFNQLLWNFNLILSGNYSNKFSLKIEYCNLDDNAYKKLNSSSADTICINDYTTFSNELFEIVKQNITKSFEKLLPNKSKFEK